VAPTVRDAADLDERVRVLRLPEQIALNRHRKATPTALRTWTQAIMECETSDGVAACWALADAVDDHGLSRDSWADTFAATPPATDALAKPLARLAAEAKLLAQASQARLPSDRTRVLAEWTAAAATSLTDRKTLSARLATVGDATQEQFYLRATFWGYHLVDRGQRLTRALRDRAIRLLLARQMWAAPTAAGTTDVAAAFPLTAVEAMMRGQNLEKYALE
jgi:lysine-N-methylase